MEAPEDLALACAPPPPLPPSSRPGSARVSAFVEKLATNIQQQRMRQLKRVQQLQAAAAARTAKQRQWEERQRHEREREAEMEQLRKQQAASNHLRASRAEVRRKERLAAAQARTEELHRQAAAKLEQGAMRAASVAAERQEVAVLTRVKHAVGAAHRVEDIRRRALLEEAEKARFMQLRCQRHKQAVQKAQEEKGASEAARRAEEERRELARRQALARAKQEQVERAAFYLQRQRQKEAELQQRSNEMAALRTLKQRERSMRAAYAKHRMELAAQREEERRAQLSSKLAEKQRRVAAMEEERVVMLRTLEDMWRDIRQQEDQLKEALRQMDSGGAAPVGKLEDLQHKLAKLLLQNPALGLPSSRGSTRQSSRPTSRARAITVGAGKALEWQDSSNAAAALVEGTPSTGSSLCSNGAADSIGSPHILAVHALPPQLSADGGHDEAGSLQPSSHASAQHPTDAQGGYLVDDAEDHQGRQSQQAPTLPPPQAREKLQRVLEMEMARESERAALLWGVGQEADRCRLLHFFELERANAMALVQRLQQLH